RDHAPPGGLSDHGTEHHSAVLQAGSEAEGEPHKPAQRGMLGRRWVSTNNSGALLGLRRAAAGGAEAAGTIRTACHAMMRAAWGRDLRARRCHRLQVMLPLCPLPLAMANAGAARPSPIAIPSEAPIRSRFHFLMVPPFLS